jgi:hypothetical protein
MTIAYCHPELVEGSVKTDFSALLEMTIIALNNYLYRLPILAVITNSYTITFGHCGVLFFASVYRFSC